mmetsp:Transcript_33364/g.97189  ORF Transcript_33364/g.97189 Transcript_33364/m.97189 type:complete len:271 (-) Transcript_33364:1995-2807(-)
MEVNSSAQVSSSPSKPESSANVRISELERNPSPSESQARKIAPTSCARDIAVLTGPSTSPLTPSASSASLSSGSCTLPRPLAESLGCAANRWLTAASGGGCDGRTGKASGDGRNLLCNVWIISSISSSVQYCPASESSLTKRKNISQRRPLDGSTLCSEHNISNSCAHSSGLPSKPLSSANALISSHERQSSPSASHSAKSSRMESPRRWSSFSDGPAGGVAAGDEIFGDGARSGAGMAPATADGTSVCRPLATSASNDRIIWRNSSSVQ